MLQAIVLTELVNCEAHLLSCMGKICIFCFFQVQEAFILSASIFLTTFLGLRKFFDHLGTAFGIFFVCSLIFYFGGKGWGGREVWCWLQDILINTLILNLGVKVS